MIVDSASEATQRGLAVSDGQTIDRYRDHRGNIEDSESIVTADRQQTCIRTHDREVLTNGQRSAGQRDGSAQAGLEVYRAARWCARDSVSERAGSGVGEIGHGAGKTAVFKRLQVQRAAVSFR